MLRGLASSGLRALARARCGAQPHALASLSFARAGVAVRRLTTGETSGPAEERDAVSVPATAPEGADDVSRMRESYLLLLADMENLRERTRREVSSAGQYAIQRFAKDVLVLVDTLEMASAAHAPAADESSASPDGLAEGVRLTLGEARRVLSRHGVDEIAAEGARFDPNFHEALYEVDAGGGVQAGTVVSVAKKGYTLNGRVIRPAQVGVSKAV